MIDPRRRRVPLILCCSWSLLLLANCSNQPKSGAPETTREPSKREPDVDEEHHSTALWNDMPSVMQSKLAHAHGIMEGLALADYRQIEANAVDLLNISNAAAWLMHDTPSYGALSDKFREAVQGLITQSRAKNINGVTESYFQMTKACIKCHEYLKSENLTKDMRGKVSNQ